MSGVTWATSLALTCDFSEYSCQACLVQDQATTFDVVRALCDRSRRGVPSPQAGSPRRRKPAAHHRNPPETTLAAHGPAASPFLPRSPRPILPTPMDCGRRTNPDQVHAQALRASLTDMAGELCRVLTRRLGGYARARI